MNQILYNTSKTTGKKKIAIFVVIALICIIACISTVFALTNKGNENILKNVFIAGVDVSEKTKEDAKAALEEKVSDYNDNEITLTLDGKEYVISSDEVGFSYENLEEVVEEAYNYGRDGNLLQNNYTILFSNFKNKEFDIEYKLDNDLYNGLIEKIVAANESIVMDDSYEMSGEKLVIRKGQDGLKIATDQLESYILTAITNKVESVEVPIINSESQKLNLQEVYAKVYVEPQDAYYTSGEKFEIIPEKNGFDFDIAKAQAAYESFKGSGEFVIELRPVEPSVKVADLDAELFKDVLSTFSTTYNETEKNRVQNLTVASERCNSTIVYPGEVFSFHKTIGTRTIANGYALGHSFAAGGKVVNTVGGGICQISSTLYNIVLKADLEIVERKNHGLYVEYAEPSLDATIAEGSIDFRFKNNRKSPIKIESEVKNGVVKMSILGMKQSDDPIIELESVVLETLEPKTIRENDSTMLEGTTKVVQSPVKGYKSEAYRIEKDSNGNVVSRTLISKDTYAATNEIIKVGTKVIKPVEPEVPVTPVQPEEPEEPVRDLPPGWDSPESPYAN